MPEEINELQDLEEEDKEQEEPENLPEKSIISTVC